MICNSNCKASGDNGLGLTGEKCFKLNITEYEIVNEHDLLNVTDKTSKFKKLFKHALVRDGYFQDLNTNILFWEDKHNISLNINRILDLTVSDFRECAILPQDQP